MEKPRTMSDDLSDSGHYDSPNDEVQDNNKPLTAPQFQRTPVFKYKSAEPNPHISTSSSAKQPSRPSTSNRPSTRPSSRKHRTQSPPNSSNSIENRVLIKLASILPDGETKQTKQINGRLPESRATLLKLNNELDEMVKDIRDLNTEHGKYLIANLYDHLKDTSNMTEQQPTINVETGHLLYDVIIAELTNQAFKKIMRINKFYRHHLVLLRNEHQKEKQSYQMEIEELKSQLQSMKFQQYGTLLPSDFKGGSNGGDGEDNNANDDDSESIDKIEATGSDSPHTPTSSSSPRRPHSPNPRSRSPSVRSPSPQPSTIQRRAAMHQAVSTTTTTTSSNDTKTNQSINLSARRSSTTNQHAKNSVDFDEFVKEKTSYAVQDNAKKLEQLHVFVLRTLEQERKVS